jgi:hypothetical protein
LEIQQFDQSLLTEKGSRFSRPDWQEFRVILTFPSSAILPPHL